MTRELISQVCQAEGTQVVIIVISSDAKFTTILAMQRIFITLISEVKGQHMSSKEEGRKKSTHACYKAIQL